LIIVYDISEPHAPQYFSVPGTGLPQLGQNRLSGSAADGAGGGLVAGVG